jgi:hypothetical protein
VKGFWAWWSLYELDILIDLLVINALNAICAGWFEPTAVAAGTMVSAFLLLVAWGILSAVADFKRKTQREHEFEHLFDGRETPPMPEGVQAELDRIAWLQRQFDRIDRERDDNW